MLGARWWGAAENAAAINACEFHPCIPEPHCSATAHLNAAPDPYAPTTAFWAMAPNVLWVEFWFRARDHRRASVRKLNP